MINVTKTFLPPFEEYAAVLKRAWDKGWMTNNGELVQELEAELKNYLQVDHLLFCSNGTVVLQMALKALGITGEVITTPFSYVATTNVILWEGCTPVFVDIDPKTFCIDADKIEAAITQNTQAILATHVYGIPCNVEKIEAIASKHHLKVIYDGAHAFGCEYKGKSLLSYGDVSTCSFHATKIFHTVEGGCIIVNDEELAQQLYLYRQFGHIYDDYISIGINGKNSELHAAMGLANLRHIETIKNNRKQISGRYDNALAECPVEKLSIDVDLQYNYAYYPVLFASEAELLTVVAALNAQSIFPRRYFFPSLNTLPFVDYKHCPVSEDISKRMLCLPLYDDLSFDEVDKIAGIVTGCSKAVLC